MPHLDLAHIHGYTTEPVVIRAPIESAHDETDIESATVRITGQPVVAATVEAPGAGDPDGTGYVVVADVTLPDTAGMVALSVEAADTAGNSPIVVAVAQVQVTARVAVAVPA